MKKPVRLYIVSGILALLLSACGESYLRSDRQIPVPTPVTPTACKPSPFEQNIVGTWHFESTYNKFNSDTVTSGTITFTAQGDIIDPDTLFQYDFGRLGNVISKSYKTDVDYTSGGSQSGRFFVVYVNLRNGQQKTPFTPIVNECKRIVLGLAAAKDYAIRITLTR